MQTLVQISLNFSALNSPQPYNGCNKKYSACWLKVSQPINYLSHSSTKIESFCKESFKIGALREKLSFSGVSRGEDGALVRRRVVLVKLNKGFNGLGGGGGGGGRDNSETARVLGNLALAILLTYLSMNGQLGWLLDAIVSLWLLAVLVPIVGIGAFLWWAGRDIVQGSCPKCGNEFQIFKSTLNDGLQLCPFCSQPFSVVGDEFVSDPVKFSNQSTTFDQGFSNFSPRSKKGGMQVYTIVREKLQGEPTPLHSNGNKKQNFVVVEEMQARLEKMQEDMNKTKQQNKVSTHRTKRTGASETVLG